jgi:hypothetical protein
MTQSKKSLEEILEEFRAEVLRNNLAERQLRARAAQRSAQARAEAYDALARAADSDARRELAERELAQARAQAERELAQARAQAERELAQARAQAERELAQARAQAEREGDEASKRILWLEFSLRQVAAALISLQSGGLLGRLRKRIRDRRHARLIRSSQLFDAGWYTQRYPEVVTSGSDPACDFLWNAVLLDRDPGPRFDSSWYLRQNCDVTRTGINPLLHYILFGAAEGRQIRSVEAP